MIRQPLGSPCEARDVQEPTALNARRRADVERRDRVDEKAPLFVLEQRKKPHKREGRVREPARAAVDQDRESSEREGEAEDFW